MRMIFTPNAPKPGGHYAQGVVHNGLVYVSGQLPIDPVTGEKKTGSIEEQTVQVLQNLQAVIEAAGSELPKVLKVTVYLSDISLWGAVNEVYGSFFGDHKPARAMVPTKSLHYGFMIEVEAVAAV